VAAVSRWWCCSRTVDCWVLRCHQKVLAGRAVRMVIAKLFQIIVKCLSWMRGWRTLCCLLAGTAVGGRMIGVDMTVCSRWAGSTGVLADQCSVICMLAWRSCIWTSYWCFQADGSSACSQISQSVFWWPTACGFLRPKQPEQVTMIVWIVKLYYYLFCELMQTTDHIDNLAVIISTEYAFSI